MVGGDEVGGGFADGGGEEDAFFACAGGEVGVAPAGGCAYDGEPVGCEGAEADGVLCYLGVFEEGHQGGCAFQEGVAGVVRGFEVEAFFLFGCACPEQAVGSVVDVCAAAGIVVFGEFAGYAEAEYLAFVGLDGDFDAEPLLCLRAPGAGCYYYGVAGDFAVAEC